MADESRVAAGKRFSSHMKKIREERGLSVDELHTQTRIARSLIESFEQGGLYEHDTFNEVYLRSFVRAYAEAIEISPEAALDGLDEALQGTYEEALADRYLHGAAPDAFEEEADEDPEPSSSQDRIRPPAAGGPEGRGGLVGPPRALGEEGPTMEGEDGPQSEQDSDQDDASGPPEDESLEASPSTDHDAETDEAEEDATTPDVPPPSRSEESSPDQEDPDTSEASSDGEGDEEEEDALDVRPSWMEEGTETDEEPVPPSATESAASEPDGTEEPPPPPAGEVGGSGIVGEPTAMGEGSSPPETQGAASPARPPASGRSAQSSSLWSRLLRGEQQEMVWASVGIAVVLVVMLGLGIAFFSSGDASTAETEPPATTVSDTAATGTASEDDTTTAPPSPPPANVTLGESIPLTILATGNVSGIRIRRDDDLRRPYWIGEGEAQVFPFEQRATIENELGDIQLFLAGYPYPLSPQDTVGGIEITRSEAEAFADTLRGAPATLSVTPDTIPVGAPQQ